MNTEYFNLEKGLILNAGGGGIWMWLEGVKPVYKTNLKLSYMAEISII